MTTTEVKKSVLTPKASDKEKPHHLSLQITGEDVIRLQQAFEGAELLVTRLKVHDLMLGEIIRAQKQMLQDLTHVWKLNS